jgi:pyridoxal phosphate enzyme (YggS family)
VDELPTDLEQRYLHILQKIRGAELLYQRKDSVNLLAVSKFQSVEKIHALALMGQKNFGENYVHEALKKMKELSDPTLRWHFIGTIQSNKIKALAQNFLWVHSLVDLKTAQRLNDNRPEKLDPLNVCVQINISHELSKTGIFPAKIDELLVFCKQIQSFPRLHLRGLMTLPKPVDLFEKQLNIFQKLADLKHELCKQGVLLDTLSMGMSNDFEAAIAAGSTWVRIGSALFGEREIKNGSS